MSSKAFAPDATLDEFRCLIVFDYLLENESFALARKLLSGQVQAFKDGLSLTAEQKSIVKIYVDEEGCWLFTHFVVQDLGFYDLPPKISERLKWEAFTIFKNLCDQEKEEVVRLKYDRDFEMKQSIRVHRAMKAQEASNKAKC